LIKKNIKKKTQINQKRGNKTMNESAAYDIQINPFNEKYNFSCAGCGKSYRVTANYILKNLGKYQKFYCLNCIEDKGDYRICEACKSKNPLGDFTCIYCGHIEILL